MPSLVPPESLAAFRCQMTVLANEAEGFWENLYILDVGTTLSFFPLCLLIIFCSSCLTPGHEAGGEAAILHLCSNKHKDIGLHAKNDGAKICVEPMTTLD